MITIRKTREELKEICKNLHIDELDSWSKYHCYKQDKWEAFLKYVLHEKEDRTNGIYAVSGGYCHDIIEKLYSGEIKYDDMINMYEDSLLTMNIAELKYDRNDSEKNEKIANKYENCVRHFFKNHNVIRQPHRIEHFIIIRITDDIVLQGYIDFMFTEKYVDENGNEKTRIRIIDWKTSTRYSGKKVEQECGQLVIYAEGIRVRNLGKKSLKEVKEKFEIKDCYVQVPLTEEKVNELKADITEKIHEFREKKREYLNTNDEMLFWQDVTDKDAFRLATLSGYSRSLHKPYDVYLKEQDMFKNNTDDEDDDIESSNDEDDLLSFLDSL